MTGTDYDLAVIGAGSGGVAAANRAASHGARVALFESGRLGGTCVNRGCVPKKLSWLAANSAETMRNAAGYGFKPVVIEHDFAELRTARDRYIEFLNGRYAQRLAENGVSVIYGRARFLDANTLTAGDATLRADNILIATGAHTRPLRIPGGELALDSDDFFRLDRRPDRVGMIGAGYIAVEFAGIFRALGSDVDIVLGGRKPLAHFDPFIGDELHMALENDGICCIDAAARAIERDDAGFTLHTGDGKKHRYDALFAVIGRIPDTADLNLAAIGISTEANGTIPVNHLQATSVPHIYAIGDVTGRAHALTPVAIAAGRRLAERLFNAADPPDIDPDLIPSVVFSHPPVATIGLTEAAARQRHGESLRVYTSRFTPLSSALIEHKRKAAVKLIVTGPEQRIVGLHVIGDGADELLQGFAVAIRMGATKRDFDETIAIHPTLAEEVVTLR